MQTESSRMKRFPEDSVIIREGEVRNENLSQYKISNENRKVIPFGERCMTFFTIFFIHAIKKIFSALYK